MKTRQIDFSSGKILENIIMSATPMLVAQLLNLMYNIVDRIYIGKIEDIGVVALGGVGLCFPVISLITAFTNLFGAGGAPLCSIERGKRNLEKAGRIMNISFYMLVVTAVILTMIGLVLSEPLLYLFGASDITIQYALPYMRIYFLGTVFSMIALGMNPFINAQGFASTGMMTIFIGAVTNIILDPVFIFGLNLGVKGAAIATVVSQIISAVFVLLFLTGKKPELKLQRLKDVEFRFDEVGDVLSLGSSSFVMQCTNSLVQIACNSMLSQFGSDLYVSCMTVINSVRQILEVPVLAIGDGSSPILSYNYGAKNYKGVKKAIRIITCAGVLYTLVAW
ncbi:MATE family efflux transporter, partial [Faecalitalea cylindroides]